MTERRIGEVPGDFQAALEHKRRVVQGIRENGPLWLKRLGVRLCHAFKGNQLRSNSIECHSCSILPSRSRPWD
jgi:hypothetical protein